MKRFFAKASKPFFRSVSIEDDAASISSTGTLTQATHSGQLKPKFLVPPIPHPCPHDHLALVVTKKGLLIRPHVARRSDSSAYTEGNALQEDGNAEDGVEDDSNVAGEVGSGPISCVRVTWGKNVKVEEIQVDNGKIGGTSSALGNAEDNEVDWSDSVIVYGIVGILELFSGSHLLVISSRTEVGHLFLSSRPVYGVKGVTAIPLTEERARITINTLSSRNAGFSRPSLLPPPRAASDSTPSVLSTSLIASESELQSADGASPHFGQTLPPPPPALRVQFSPVNDVKMMTPQSDTFHMGDDHYSGPVMRHVSSSRNSSSSDLSATSTANSELSITTSPVAKTIADRLSFWTRLSKRTVSSALEGPYEPNTYSADAEAGSTGLSKVQKALETVMEEKSNEPSEVLETILATTAPPPETTEEKHSELEDKIVKECIREFTRGGMYFAYTFDITRSLQQKQEQILQQQQSSGLSRDYPPTDEAADPIKVNALSEPHPTLPLWRRVDKRFWWNEWISRPFMDAGLHSYVLPIMQGYFQISTFIMPADPELHDDDIPVDYIIISRRSRHRAGLRYQRRGIDDDAHVANFVETETIMRVQRLDAENVFSYVQIRGSIPLFWTQSGNGLKPPPLLATDRTDEQNLDVLRRHFQRTIPRYGPHTVMNLAEQHGKEGAITQGYRDYMQQLNMKHAQYDEYDFHVETKGMKYENIRFLIERMEKTFESQGYLWISDNTLLSQQRGVFRVNCIDCLDRTNVVQSAFARHILNKQLGAVALLNPNFQGRSEIDVVVNDVWANNGDAISRAYAGTSALKGDFTRTGKRDLSGLLNDGVNSLARMYTSTFSDWFCQAVIDFMLGNRTLSVFSEFLLKLQSTDPRDLIRLSRIRAEAISTSAARVLEEGEHPTAGWTLFAPEDLNARVGDKFEEKVLLLTVKALYIISYDYTLEKVKSYTRVPLGDIIEIAKGAYILSPLEEASRDPAQNAGFTITWLNSNQVTRVTSYSVRNTLNMPVPPSPTTPFQTSPPSSPITATIKPFPPSASTSANATGPASASEIGLAYIQSKKASLTVATRSGFQRLSRRSTTLSNVLENAAALVANSDRVFAAFKVLPIDPARLRESSTVERAGSGSGGASEGGSGGHNVISGQEELETAENCKDAAEMIVETIRKACEDIGNVHNGFVTNEDVVSLAEAQRMTSLYAKMEYGVKRLLWLGG
ncbi:hypothetical protein BDN72DRAFT_964483 [Pluteus cervinus]|uniref:Uncharacterized protein n=1 Tax=Pluteus cervinus TaxID=181527 RepID=A0ACD3A9Z2_9AGAR|nr:hypothetical protein BDN72DRAFT_964483 [Pluteus cervinus]